MYRRNRILIFLLFLLPLSVMADADTELQDLFSQEDYESALLLVETQLQSDPNNVQWMLARGFTLVKLGRLDKAEAYYLQLIGRLPDRPEPRNNLAMVYNLRGEFGKAVKALDQIIIDFPNYARAYENLGDTYINIAQYQYQLGLDKTGEAIFERKSRLSENFDQIANHLNPPQIFKKSDLVPTDGSGQVQRQLQKPVNNELEKSVYLSLQAWAKDWMSMDFNRYGTHYARQFVPQSGISIDAWMEKKKRVFARAGSIQVALSEIDIKVKGDTALIWFIQLYNSDEIRQKSKKFLELRRSDQSWLIVKEESQELDITVVK